MTRTEIERLYAYNRWANARTVEVVAALNDEQYHRDLKSSFPSVHATLLHMLAAEWVWLERWKGSSPTAWPDQADLTALAAVRGRWQEIEQGQRFFIASLTDERLAAPFAYSSLAGAAFHDPLDATMQHVVNHASYHRGQVTTMVRQLGAPATGTDYITFVRETLRIPT